MRKLYGDQETNISRTQICIDGQNMDCWVASSSVRADIARLKKMGWELVNENPDGSCVFRSFVESAVRISKNEKQKKSLTQEQREANRERLARARENKKRSE